MINKIITLENDEEFLIIKKVTIKKDEFLIGVRLENNKYLNDFRFFIENNKNGEKFLEEIKDSSLIKLIIDKFLLDSFD